jgi:hypothetical protein
MLQCFLVFLFLIIYDAVLVASQNSSTFAVVTVFTVHEPWISGDVAKLGLLYGLKAQSTYALSHGYGIDLYLKIVSCDIICIQCAIDIMIIVFV